LRQSRAQNTWWRLGPTLRGSASAQHARNSVPAPAMFGRLRCLGTRCSADARGRSAAPPPRQRGQPGLRVSVAAEVALNVLHWRARDALAIARSSLASGRTLRSWLAQQPAWPAG
jgi:hypothetical protein